MIRRVTFALLLLISFSVFAQPIQLPSSTNYRPDILGINQPQPSFKGGVATLLLINITTPYTDIAYEYDDNYRLVNVEQTDEGVAAYNLKETFQYTDGRNTKIDYYSILELGSDWFYSAYQEFEYDDKGFKLTRTNANNLGTGFVIGGIGYYSYNDNLLVGYLQMLHVGQGQYDSLSNSIYTYNELNRVTSEIVYAYNSEFSEWWKGDSSSYIYDEIGRLAQRRDYTFYPDENTWKHSSKTEWSYEDNSVYWVEEAQYLGNTAGTGWASNPDQKFVIHYENTEKAVLYPTLSITRGANDNWFVQSNSGAPKKYINEEDFYATNIATNELTFIETAEYLYTEINNSSTIHKNETISMEVYPNPATDNIIINGVENGRVEFYNMHGELAQVLPHVEGRPLNVSMLKSGLYIIKLVTKTTTLSSKFIKQ